MAAKTVIAKWGNSLAVRIPRSVARDARLAEGDRVELQLNSSGGIELRPARPHHEVELFPPGGPLSLALIVF